MVIYFSIKDVIMKNLEHSFNLIYCHSCIDDYDIVNPRRQWLWLTKLPLVVRPVFCQTVLLGPTRLMPLWILSDDGLHYSCRV